MMNYAPIIRCCMKHNVKSLLDIGCHIGEFAQTMNLNLRLNKVLCIDFNASVAEHITDKGFEFVCCPLSDQIKTATLYYDKDNRMSTGNSIYLEQTRHFVDPVEEKAICYPLDLLAIGNYDLIKMDVQGSEYDVVDGGRDTIQHAKLVVLETQIKEYNAGAKFQNEIADLMQSLGFRIIGKVGTGYVNDELYQEDLLFENQQYE